MKLFFERNKVLLFSIELNPSTTVLEMKQKIEESTGISISNQTIFFKGKILHTDRDAHTLKQCKIANKSRLELHFSRSRLSYSRLSHNISQALQQTPAPSTSVKDVINIEDSLEKNQDSSNDDQVLYQTEKSLVPSCSFNGRQRAHQDWLQRESSSTSNIFGDFLFGEDPPLSTFQRVNEQDLPVSQVVQTQKPTRPIRDVINIPDSPESGSNKRAKKLLRVMVLSFATKDTPSRKFPVEVNPRDNVEELRIELAKMQQTAQILLPEGGYFFIHKTQVLYEKQSFRWNRVDQGDTIAIFPGIVTD